MEEATSVEERAHDRGSSGAPRILTDVCVLGPYVPHVAVVPIIRCTEYREISIGEHTPVGVVRVRVVLSSRLHEAGDLVDDLAGRTE